MNLIVLSKQSSINSQADFGIGFETRQEEITQWLKQHYPHPFTLTSLKQSTHLRCTKGGFEVQFKQGKVDTVFVYFRTPKIDSFEDPVWLGINNGWTIKGAVTYLGEPAIKNKKMMEIIYPHLGLGMVFRGNWSNQSSPIEYCYLFKREETQNCGSCSNPIEKVFFRCLCGRVVYCNQTCKQKHYGHHLIICEEGKPF